MLPEFDIAALSAPAVCVFTGVRFCGKTHAMNAVCNQLRPTRVLRFECLSTPFDPVACRDFLKAQMEATQGTAAVVVDGVGVGDEESAALLEVACDGRACKTSLLVSEQYARLPQALRQNADYLFVFYNDNPDEQHRYWKRYGEGIFATFKDFEGAMQRIAGDRGACLVIDTNNIRVFRWNT